MKTSLIILILVACFVSFPCLASDRITEQIEDFLAKQFRADKPGGVVLVARNSKPVFRHAYGLADMELIVPMTPETKIKIGSITKQFTAIAVLKLISEGKLALSDDVREYLPSLPAYGKRITIEQVLTHTSGLPNLVDLNDFDVLARKDYTAEQLLALTNHLPLHFEPGLGFRYSDTGYILLGAMIERISGMSYRDYLEKRIFQPIGMNNTFYGDDKRLIQLRAKGYSLNNEQIVNAPYISMTVPHGSGALVSTVDDLLRWDIALRNGSVVPRELLDLAWKGRILPDGTPSGYGFGWKVCKIEGYRTIEHGGFINGFNATAIRLPDEDLNIIVLVNNDFDTPDAGATSRRLARLILTGSTEPKIQTLSSERMKALIGTYRIGPGDELKITEEAGSLYSQRNDHPRRKLSALSGTELILADGDASYAFRFELGSDGRATKVKRFLSCEPSDTAVRVN
ncbi:serine hydrolase [bacterium]|nr:serine hydrolase [bacterium]